MSSKAVFQKFLQSLFNCFLIFCVTHMILLISTSFPIPFCSYTFPFLSCYRVLYNLYLNPLKILSNYTYTISKVTTLHTYILTSCLIFLYTFSLSLLLFPFSFIHFYLLYFSFMHFYLTFLLFLHIVLLCPNWSYYIWLFILPF